MHKFNLVILAAGSGKRLGRGKNAMPKALTKINGWNLLERILYNFKEFDVMQKFLVTGFRENEFSRYDEELTRIYNEKYAETNMLYSLTLALDQINNNNSVFITYSDIIYSKEIVKKILGSDGEIVIASDKNWFQNWTERFNNPIEDLEVFEIEANKKIVKKIGGRPLNYNQINGQYMGLILIKAVSLNEVKERIKILKEVNKELIQKGYLTDLLQLLIDEGKLVKYVENSDPWFEIDQSSDLKILENKIIEIDKKIYN